MPKDHPELARARELGSPSFVAPSARRSDRRTRARRDRRHTRQDDDDRHDDGRARRRGREPTALAGGRVRLGREYVRPGSRPVYVVEADEYDRSFLALSPTVAVVNNIEADHLDIYADLADIKRAFAQFARGARTSCSAPTTPGANALPTPSSTEVVRYGIASPDARLRRGERASRGARPSSTVVFDDERLGECASSSGRAQCAQRACRDRPRARARRRVPAMARGLAAFRGVERRFQRLGEAAASS